MNFLVLEDDRAPVFTLELLSKHPSLSVVTVDKNSNSSLLDSLKSKPLLSKKWIVLVKSSVSESHKRAIASSTLCIGIFYSTKTALPKDKALISEFGEYKLINMLNPSKKWIIEYVMNSLGVDYTLAESICNKGNKFFPYIHESVLMLQPFKGEITSYHINTFLQEHLSCNPTYLFESLLNVNKCNTTTIVKYFYQFRYAFSYLKTELLNLCRSVIMLYSNIQQGNLGNDNIEEYVRSLPRDTKISIYLIRQTVSVYYPRLTLESILVIYKKINMTSNILQLMSLFI